MIDPKRIGRFLFNLLLVAIPFLITVFGLALLTEIWTGEAEILELLVDWGFWLAVILDTFPAITAMMLAIWLAGRFARKAYGLNSLYEAIKFLLSSRFGLPSFSPWVKIQKGELAKGGAEIITRLGGPGNLVVFHDSAVVLERGGQLTEVQFAIRDGKQQFPRLRAFEKIYNIVDLRPKRWVHTVEAMSKEGIPINWEVEVQYQIEGGNKHPTEKEPYPFSEQHVFQAAVSDWASSQGGGEVMDWESQVVLGTTAGNLRNILAQRRLDQLIGLTEAEEKAARESIQTELESRVRQAAPGAGAKILQIKLGNLEVEDTVTEQWIRNWQARWQRWSARQLAEGEASRIYMYETVKAEAQMHLIVSITQELRAQLANQTITTQAIPQIILMRLFSALDRGAFSRTSRVFFPSEALDALGKLEALRQLAQGDG